MAFAVHTPKMYRHGSSTPSLGWSSPDTDSDDAHMPMTPSSELHGDSLFASKETTVKVLILGAGPTGLGAAHQLEAKNCSDWLMVDSCNRAGGMAITEEDEQGFLWDLGGHVIHSHYAAFDKAIALHDDWVHPRRGGWVRVQEQWCPTPIQQSLGNLRNGEQIRAELLTGSRSEGAARPTASSSNLGDYYRNAFGQTLNETFFAPFNRKQWAWDLTQLDHSWTSLRSGSGLQNVPQASQKLERLEKPKDTSSFPYPRLGTGSLWQSIASSLPARNQRYSATVQKIDIKARRAYLSTGEVVSYTRCISSIPLNKLIGMIGDQHPELKATLPDLKASSTTAVGLGFTGELPAALHGKSWVFSADPEVSFHRATVLTNFSPDLSNNGSKNGEPRWSIMFETSSSSHRPIAIDQDSLVADHLAELRRWGAVGPEEKPLSVWYKHLEMGYPLPFIGRDELLASEQSNILSKLEQYGILTRGRFGGWRYESSNQDYAFVQGVEAVDVMSNGQVESVYWSSRPDTVKLPLLDLTSNIKKSNKQIKLQHINNTTKDNLYSSNDMTAFLIQSGRA
jgi:protoporphyrinogen oxidase